MLSQRCLAAVMTLSISTATAHAGPAGGVIELRPDRVYELAALWVALFAKALPIAVRHRARPLASLKPVHVYRGDLKPTSLALAAWSSPEAFRATFADPELKPLLPSRDAALEKVLVTHFRAQFESEGL